MLMPPTYTGSIVAHRRIVDGPNQSLFSGETQLLPSQRAVPEPPKVALSGKLLGAAKFFCGVVVCAPTHHELEPLLTLIRHDLDM